MNENGWIDWHGGECPVFGRAFVEFETRIGTTGKRRAHELVWQHGMLDIVAYRVVPADQPAVKESLSTGQPQKTIAEEINDSLPEFNDALDQPAEPEKQPQHTPGPWGVEQTQTTNWIGPLRADGKVDRIVAHNDRHNLTPTVLAERDANARLIAQAPSLESTIEECIRQRDEAEAAADELTSLVLSEPVDWAFHNEAWQRAVQRLRETTSEPDCTLPTTSPHEGCHVVRAEKQPQPDEWCYIRSKNTKEEFVARFMNRKSDGTPIFECPRGELWREVEILRHLPNCTGFDYVPPPEQTPAEKRLRELGIERDKDGDYRSVRHRTVLGLSDFTSEQIEAIAAHMREREGGEL